MPEPEIDPSPGRRDWPAGGLPIVFQNPPKRYAVVKPENLAEWERITTEMLGLAVEQGDTHFAGLETVSFCGEKPDGDPNPCDSDILPQVLEA